MKSAQIMVFAEKENAYVIVTTQAAIVKKF